MNKTSVPEVNYVQAFINGTAGHLIFGKVVLKDVITPMSTSNVCLRIRFVFAATRLHYA